MSLLHLVLQSIVRACMLCCAVLQLWKSEGSAGVAAESGPAVCDLCPFLGSGVQTIVLRGLCVSGQEYVLRLVIPARCHQHGLSTHQRLQPFTFCASRSGSICCANARHLGSYFSLNTLTHVLPCSPCKPDFHSCSIVWILLANPAQSLASVISAWCIVSGHAGHSQVPSWS